MILLNIFSSTPSGNGNVDRGLRGRQKFATGEKNRRRNFEKKLTMLLGHFWCLFSTFRAKIAYFSSRICCWIKLTPFYLCIVRIVFRKFKVFLQIVADLAVRCTLCVRYTLCAHCILHDDERIGAVHLNNESGGLQKLTDPPDQEHCWTQLTCRLCWNFWTIYRG